MRERLIAIHCIGAEFLGNMMSAQGDLFANCAHFKTICQRAQRRPMPILPGSPESN